MIIALILTTVVLSLLIAEKWYLNRLIRKIPVRILVNGTRGKSTVVKYISLLFRSNGLNTLSKITGIIPTIYYQDDSSYEIKRRGGARITEQFRMIYKAVRRNAEAIVLENMSITPELQKIESSVLKPHYYVITNILEDHLEEMGKTPEEWVEAICSAIPNNCTVVTAEHEYLDSIKKYASERNSRVIAFNEVTVPGYKPITIPHPDNFRIAEVIAREEKLKSEELYRKVNLLHKDEVYTTKKINGFEVSMVNAFAANDVPSAKRLYLKKIPDGKNTIVLFNSRGDRPLRTVRFIEWLSSIKVDRYFLSGDNSGLAKKKLIASGVESAKISILSSGMCKEILKVLEEYIKLNTVIFGCGNIKNAGMDVINCFKGSD